MRAALELALFRGGEGTSEQQMLDIAKKFVDRARCLATDGFTIYDIQDEASRTNDARPFPFRRTLPPEEFATPAGLRFKPRATVRQKRMSMVWGGRGLLWMSDATA